MTYKYIILKMYLYLRPMKKYFIVVLLLIPFSLFAGDAHYLNGSRAMGMGGASLTLSDVWSVENNQAAMAFMDKPAGGLFYQNRFLLKELGIKGADIIYPLHNNAIGLNLTQYGYTAYSENKIGISFGQKLNENLAAGIQLNYGTTQLGEDYGKKSNFMVAAGIMAKLNDQISIVAHVYNPTRAKLADYNDERNAAILGLGASYRFSKEVNTVVEIDKDIDYKAMLKAGIEYQPLPHFYLRAGIASNPFQSSFGFGYVFREIHVDVAASYHNVLGLTPGISIYYAPVEKTK